MERLVVGKLEFQVLTEEKWVVRQVKLINQREKQLALGSVQLQGEKLTFL